MLLFLLDQLPTKTLLRAAMNLHFYVLSVDRFQDCWRPYNTLALTSSMNTLQLQSAQTQLYL